jgi:hypothetical protein
MMVNDQNAMTNGNGCLLGPSTTGDAAILRRQIGILAMGSGMSCLDQQLTGVRIAFSRFSREAFASTFVVAWTVG